MAVKCGACGRFSNTAEGAKCTKCATVYHRACVNIPKDAKVVSGWQCPGCKVQTPRRDNSENPLRGEEADYCSEGPATGDSAEILREIRLLRGEMSSLKNAFGFLETHLTELRDIVGGFGSRLSNVETRLDSIEKSSGGSQAGPDVESLLMSIEQLKTELNDRDQDSFQNDLELTGIPEEQAESAEHLVRLIAVKLGVACDPRDIVFVERMGLRRAPSSGESGSAVRPRALVLRLARKQLRDSLLQAARVRRGLTTEGLGLAAAPTKFYLNERLTKYNKMLFYKVREEARAHGWKYVWTRGGRILVRRESGKASSRIRSETDFEKVFGRVSSKTEESP